MKTAPLRRFLQILFLQIVLDLLRYGQGRRHERDCANQQFAGARLDLFGFARAIDVAVDPFGHGLHRNLAFRALLLIEALRARADHLLLSRDTLAGILAVR